MDPHCVHVAPGLVHISSSSFDDSEAPASGFGDDREAPASGFGDDREAPASSFGEDLGEK